MALKTQSKKMMAYFFQFVYLYSCKQHAQKQKFILFLSLKLLTDDLMETSTSIHRAVHLLWLRHPLQQGEFGRHLVFWSSGQVQLGRNQTQHQLGHQRSSGGHQQNLNPPRPRKIDKTGRMVKWNTVVALWHLPAADRTRSSPKRSLEYFFLKRFSRIF